MQNIEAYVGGGAEPKDSRTENTERLRAWVVELMEQHREVLFTWGRLKQELTPAYRAGKANVCVHRTLNAMGARETADWDMVFRGYECHRAYAQGLYVIRPGAMPLSERRRHVFNVSALFMIDLLEAVSDTEAFQKAVRAWEARAGHKLTTYEHKYHVCAIASVKKEQPKPGVHKKPERQRAMPRFAIPVTNAWREVG